MTISKMELNSLLSCADIWKCYLAASTTRSSISISHSPVALNTLLTNDNFTTLS